MPATGGSHGSGAKYVLQRLVDGADRVVVIGQPVYVNVATDVNPVAGGFPGYHATS
jgi:hypothetical protein